MNYSKVKEIILKNRHDKGGIRSVFVRLETQLNSVRVFDYEQGFRQDFDDPNLELRLLGSGPFGITIYYQNNTREGITIPNGQTVVGERLLELIKCGRGEVRVDGDDTWKPNTWEFGDDGMWVFGDDEIHLSESEILDAKIEQVSDGVIGHYKVGEDGIPWWFDFRGTEL